VALRSAQQARVALLIDPRFPGGTSGAVAAEIRALAPHVNLAVVALETRMFRGRPINPAITSALRDVALPLLPEPAVLRADAIVLHNPTCLRFERHFGPRLSAARTIVVTHENLIRPDGVEGFDVAHCLGLVEARLAAGEGLLAPISAGNRASVAAWLARHPGSRWRLAPIDWRNVCDHPLLAPNARPRDRRGRHSRPGFEKFPPISHLHAQFPPHAERCAILGADTLLRDPTSVAPHWELHPFGAIAVADFLAEIDFFVYFTHPRWRESFGRAIAEAVAAGKLVITDQATAEAFGPGVLAGDATEVDAVVAGHVRDPGRYAATVRRAQADLAEHRPERVASGLMNLVDPEVPIHASV
jgi:hypothetical protein